MTAKKRAAYEEGGFRFDPPAYDPDRVALVELETAIQILQSWTRRPSEIRAALAIPSAQALARWRRDKTSIPWPIRERAAIVLALGHRLSGGVDFVTLKPLPDLTLRGRPAIAGRAVLAGGMQSELLALLLQLVLAEEAEEAAERRRKRRKGVGDDAECATIKACVPSAIACRPHVRLASERIVAPTLKQQANER